MPKFYFVTLYRTETAFEELAIRSSILWEKMTKSNNKLLNKTINCNGPFLTLTQPLLLFVKFVGKKRVQVRYAKMMYQQFSSFKEGILFIELK